MRENPFEPPRSDLGPKSQPRGADLEKIALGRKCALICGSIQVVLLVAEAIVPGEARAMLGLAMMILLIVEAVFATLLALRFHGTALAIVLGLLTLIPFFGLLPLFFVVMKATTVLRHGRLDFDIRNAPKVDFPEF